jgi:hypothetical protein
MLREKERQNIKKSAEDLGILFSQHPLEDNPQSTQLLLAEILSRFHQPL